MHGYDGWLYTGLNHRDNDVGHIEDMVQLASRVHFDGTLKVRKRICLSIASELDMTQASMRRTRTLSSGSCVTSCCGSFSGRKIKLSLNGDLSERHASGKKARENSVIRYNGNTSEV